MVKKKLNNSTFHFIFLSFFFFSLPSYFHLSFFFPLHISFYFYFRFGSIFVFLTACSLFFMNRYCMQTRWKKTLKLSFLTPKGSFFYLIFISNTFVFFISLSMFSLFLCFSQSFHFFGFPPFILFS